MSFTRILSLTVSLYLDKLKLKSELCLMTDPWAQLDYCVLEMQSGYCHNISGHEGTQP